LTRVTQFLPGVGVEQRGDTVVVHAEATSRWWGVLPAAAAGVALFGGFFGLVFAVPLVALAVFLFLPRKTTTVFDLRARRVLHRFNTGEFARTRTYAFAEIAGLGVLRHISEGSDTYRPVLKVANGPTHGLAGASEDQFVSASLVGTVCEATGLARIDVPAWGT
jgi:hypothetical protein